jgi:D-cysteine desulfhydrase
VGTDFIMTLLFMWFRYAGMESHLLLRTSRVKVGEDPGLVGNLLLERLIGANIYTVS